MSDFQNPGSGQNPSNQPQYVQQAPVIVGYQPAPPKGLSITSMVLGLVSIVLGFTFIVPLLGFILGIVGLRKEPAGRGMAITGLILNGLFVLGWALVVIAVVGIGAAGVATNGS